MTDTLLSEIIKYIRSHTALQAWFAEILTVFVFFTTGRFALAVWMRTTAYPGKPWWEAWLYAYDNLRHYSDDALIAGLLFAIVFEGGIMFLARKRIALSRVEGREEGLQEGHQTGREEGLQEGHQTGRDEGRQEGRVEGRQEGRAEAEPAAAAQIRALQERIRELEARNGSNPDA